MKVVRTKISADKLSASVTIVAVPEDFPDENEILEKLKEDGIVFGIDRDKVKQLAENKEQVTSIPIARGKNPSGRIKWHIKLDNPHKPTITSTDRADFKQLISYNYIQKGQKILTLSDSADARPGRTVDGNTIEVPDAVLNLPKFKNIKTSEDGKTLIARDNGYLHWEENILTVSNVFHVRGDVDYSTGNLKVKGPVVIDGDVRSGFRVETDASIFVEGTVDAASLYAQNGDITIGHGILGQNRAKILCGGSLKCGFMQDASIAVKNDVIIDQYAINCTISAGGVVKTNNKGSVIRGGTVTAEKGIITDTVGSKRSIFTELKIRNYREGDSQSQLWKLSRERTNLKVRLSSLLKRKEFLHLLEKGVNKLSTEKQEEIEFINSEADRLRIKLKALDQEEILLQRETLKETVQKEVRIQGVLYRNVLIDIGGSEYFSDKELMQVSLTKIAKDIVVSPLKEVSQPEDSTVNT